MPNSFANSPVVRMPLFLIAVDYIADMDFSAIFFLLITTKRSLNEWVLQILNRLYALLT